MRERTFLFRIWERHGRKFRIREALFFHWDEKERLKSEQTECPVYKRITDAVH